MTDNLNPADPKVAGYFSNRFTTTIIGSGSSAKVCGPDGSRTVVLVSARSTVLNGQILELRAGSNASAPVIAHLAAGSNFIEITAEKHGPLAHYELWATAAGGDNTVCVTETLRVR